MKLLRKIFKSKHKTKQGDVYACLGGNYKGHMLVLVSKDSATTQFLMLPVMQNIDIENSLFDADIEDNTVEYVETLPKEIFDICYLQYIKNIPSYKY